MKKNSVKKTAIFLLLILALGSTLLSKKANAHTSDDESSSSKMACVYVMPNPGQMSYSCSGLGNMCETKENCRL